MADYANIDQVKYLLSLEDDTSADERLAQLNTVVSRELEQVVGLAPGSGWGATEPEEDRARTFYPDGASETLWLTPPIRAVTTVTADGRTLTEGVDFTLVNQRGAFWQALYRMPTALGWSAINRDGAWSGWCGTVVVTGQWADQGVDGDVDPAIVEAANVIVAGYWRRDQSSGGEVSGPEGLTFRPGDPWRDARVVYVKEHYGVNILVTI